MRQIVLDTETTGLDPQQGHRIIEIGCVEIERRKLTGNTYHQYLNPERAIDEAAQQVHGLDAEFLSDKPVFSAIADEFMAFIANAELIIHNAPFDVGFLNHELALLKHKQRIEDIASVFDSLIYARKKHPGQRNTLDALCKRYAIDNTQRQLHGALLDSEILADVYLRMTGGQVALAFNAETAKADAQQLLQNSADAVRKKRTKIITCSAEELAAHEKVLEEIEQQSGNKLVWN